MVPKKRYILTIAALALTPGCFGEAPAPGPDVRWPETIPASLLIRNTSVFDVEAGTLTPSQDVRVEDGVIAAIEPTGTLDGERVIDGEGAVLVPGLIDMHGHVYTDSSATWDPGVRGAEGPLRSYAYSGVTTVFDPADSSAEAYERRDRIARRELVGPRVFTTGPMLTCSDGHPRALIAELMPWWISWYVVDIVAPAVDDVETAYEVVDELADNGADAIKITVDAIPLDAPRMHADIASAVVERAKTRGLRVVAHIGTTEDAIRAADAGIALWVHGVYKERIPDDQIAKLAGYGIPMVATTEVFDRYARGRSGPIVPTKLERETVYAPVLDAFWPVPDDFETGRLEGWLDLAVDTMDVRTENVRRLRAAGVTILAGSDTQAGVFPGAGLHRELGHLVRAGMTPAEAIRAATLDSARWLANGSEPDFGSIAVGKRADLVLVEGDPTVDVAALQNIREVILAGVPIERTPVPRP